MPMSSLPGAPMIHSSAMKMTSSRNVVPRSLPIITSMHITAAPGSSGTSRYRQSVSCPSRSLRASRSAPHSTSPSLANSDGCTSVPATISHRLAPSTSGPNSSTSTSPAMLASSSGYAQTRNSLAGALEPSHISASPAAAPSSCFSNIEYAGRP